MLGQKVATGMIPPHSSYQYKYCHIFIYIFFICLYEYFSTIYSCFISCSCVVCVIYSLDALLHHFETLFAFNADIYTNSTDSAAILITKEDIREQAKLGYKDVLTEKNNTAMAISSISDAKLQNLIDIFELTIVDGIADILPVVIPFSQFDWKGRQEDNKQAMAEACEHLQTQLSKFGVIFGRGGYKLCDVHSSRSILNVQHSKFSLTGGTDFIIIPFETNVRLGAPKELCVIFELKTDVAMEGGIQKYHNQAIVEAIAARYVSHQPGILSVLTDLKNNTSMFEYSYGGDLKFSIVTYENVSLEFMASKVSAFLRDITFADAKYVPPNEIAEASEREKGVVVFKKHKIEHYSSLAFEHLQDMMMDSSNWTMKERAQLVANLFESVEQPMPISVQYAMYS